MWPCAKQSPLICLPICSLSSPAPSHTVLPGFATATLDHIALLSAQKIQKQQLRLRVRHFFRRENCPQFVSIESICQIPFCAANMPSYSIVRDEQSKKARCQVSKWQTVNMVRMKCCPECRSLTRNTLQIDSSTSQLCVFLEEWQSKAEPPDTVRSRCEERIKHTCASIGIHPAPVVPNGKDKQMARRVIVDVEPYLGGSSRHAVGSNVQDMVCYCPHSNLTPLPFSCRRAISTS